MILDTNETDILYTKNERYLLLRDFSGTLRLGIITRTPNSYMISSWMEGFPIELLEPDGWEIIDRTTDIVLGTNSLKLPDVSIGE